MLWKACAAVSFQAHKLQQAYLQIATKVRGHLPYQSSVSAKMREYKTLLYMNPHLNLPKSYLQISYGAGKWSDSNFECSQLSHKPL